MGTPDYPVTNIRFFQDYTAMDDSLASLDHQRGHCANYDPGGEETGVLERWSVGKVEIKIN